MSTRIKLFSLICLVALTVGLVFYASKSAAQIGAAATLWRDVNPSNLLPGGTRIIKPRRFRTVALDPVAVRALLSKAPMEFSLAAKNGGRVEISLPKPDGSLARFKAEESPIMEPGLAAKFPSIKTYRAQGVDDPAATARFGITPYGFHAIVLSPSGAYYIDPYRRGDSVNHISYFKTDYARTEMHAFECLVHLPDSKGTQTLSVESASATRPHGDVLRTYRLALASTFEYSDFHSDAAPLPDKADVMAQGIIPAVNRVTGIYEREVAVHLTLVANNDLIIFNTPADPYVNDQGITMLATNQATVDAVIGTLNYDIGHVASTGGGGVAFLGVVCSVQKAGGVTGLPQPTGDPYYVDYVAHEMGHQFGGNHTFNGSVSNCAGGNQNPGTAYEVGSGSTIQAYAGICAPQNLQPNSDPYFHGASYDEILDHITGSADSCAVKTPTGNSAPAVEAGIDYNIPARTPFTLTAAGSDPDGDTLTFGWEEFDLGPPHDGRSDNGSSAIFRSFNPSVNPSRTFPKQSDLLNNVTTYGELLPTTTRVMTFRVTARDNRAGSGGVEYDSMKVHVNASAGPFAVTSPNGDEWWTSGSTKTISWAVANTDQAPISATYVDIHLSTDGGQTFPIVLASAVPNDGSHDIAVPAVSTADARIRVSATGNIFFDLSNADFFIDPPQQAPVAINDIAAAPFQTSGFLPVMRNDSDVDSPVLSIAAVQSPTNKGGHAVVHDNGTPDNTADDGIFYSAPPQFSGVDQFTYTISDGQLTATAQVTVSITPFCAFEPTGSFIANFETDNNGFTVLTPGNPSGSQPWTRSPDPKAHSPLNSFFTEAVSAQAAVKDDRLVSPPQLISSTTRLHFWHRFDLENDWDGGVLEVSTNGGASYVDVTAAGGVFVQGAYSKIMGNGGLAGRSAWTGRSPGMLNGAEMNEVEVDLAALAGTTAIFRWRLRTDDLTVDETLGWWVDDIQFTNLLVAPPCNEPPYAFGQTVSTNEDTAVSITLSSADDGDTPVTYSVQSGPGNGTLSGTAPNLTYTPAPNFNGSDSFTFKADDGANPSNVAKVAIVVASVNDAPSATVVANPQSGEAPLTVMLDASASSDPEGDSIQSYTFKFGDGTSEVTQSGAAVSHVYTAAGTYTASVVVTDADGASSVNTATATIQVREAPALETIEDNDPQIAYSSAWHLENYGPSSGGHFRYHTGKSPNHSAKLSFFVPAGRVGAITYHYGRSKNGGTADLYLDGVKKAAVSYKGGNGSTKAPEINNSLSLAYADLQPGTHTIELNNLDGVVYLDRFVLQTVSSAAPAAPATSPESGSTSMPASGPGATTSQSNSAGGGNSSSTTYQAPSNSQSMSIFTESSVNLPYQLVLISPQGLTLKTVNASNGMATIEQPLTQGGAYVIKVVNLNVGPLQFTSTVTPLQKR
ncbi:MAG TPA: zinc-dependent metalloprotease family protein [Pyrinomonadaceae bacterium]|nr:zinc-dependent metalloprotease family protein [Pyrinomonadaceae bacterium]